MTKNEFKALQNNITHGRDFSISVPFDATPEVRSFCGYVIEEATLELRNNNAEIVLIKRRAAKLMKKK